MVTGILDEVHVLTDTLDADTYVATVTLYRYGLRVTVWSATEWEVLYTEHISFYDYPDIASSLVICDGLIYRECVLLVRGLLPDGAAGMAAVV